jgi:sugar/nucleoside kinase (ribokinase family)
MILCLGSIALDTTRTPFGVTERLLGGSAAYFSVSASFFTKVAAVGAVGGDFPQQYWDVLKRFRIDLSGVQRKQNEKTFFFDSEFDYDMYHRRVHAVESGVYKDFEPKVPERHAGAEFVYVGTMYPETQLAFLEQVPNRKLAFMDTIEKTVSEDRDRVLKVVSQVDGLVINDAEARRLCDTPNLVKAGYKIIDDLGPKIAVIKKGEHGSMLFFDGAVYPFPAYPLEDIVDPTGAGDVFAGGFFGYLASKKGSLDERTLRKAVAYGTVMGSFAVEDQSMNRLLSLGKSEIRDRYAHYKKVIYF